MKNGANALGKVNRTSSSKEAGLDWIGEVRAVSWRHNFLMRRIGRSPVTNFGIKVLGNLVPCLVHRSEDMYTGCRTVGNPESGFMCLNASRVDRLAMLNVQVELKIINRRFL
jgi:hypothetical protein